MFVCWIYCCWAALSWAELSLTILYLILMEESFHNHMPQIFSYLKTRTKRLCHLRREYTITCTKPSVSFSYFAFWKYTRCSISLYALFFCGGSTNWKGRWGSPRSCWKNHRANKVPYRIYLIEALIHLKTNIRIASSETIGGTNTLQTSFESILFSDTHK